MDSFFNENKKFLSEQIAAFEAQLAKENVATNSNLFTSDTLIGARIRPLLQREVDNGQLDAISTKSTEGSATVHELRAKVNGKPAINASSSILIGEDRYC